MPTSDHEDYMNDALDAILELHSRDLICRCADVCDERADARDQQVAISSEARKCADQIRHVMLAETSVSRVCFWR